MRVKSIYMYVHILFSNLLKPECVGDSYNNSFAEMNTLLYRETNFSIVISLFRGKSLKLEFYEKRIKLL